MRFYRPGINMHEEMERAVLGAMLLEKTAIARVISILDENCFYYPINKLIFVYMKKMWDRSEAIDCLTLHHFVCRSEGERDYDGFHIGYWITNCIKDVVSTAHLEQHSILLRRMYVDRELIALTTQGTDGSKDLDERIKSLQDELLNLSLIKTADDWLDMSAMMVNLSQHMDKVRDLSMIGITTGFKGIDRVTGGLMPGQLVIVGARPSVGKSAFMGKMVLHAAMSGKHVGIVSLEMESTQVAGRILSLDTDIEFWRIYKAKLADQQQSDTMYQRMAEMANLPIKISDKTQVSISDIKAKAIQLIHRKELDILFIDYLQLMEGETTKNSNREQEIGKISRGLKLLAMEYKIPVVALCQLNRQSEARSDKRPRLSDLRESGNIEQDADGVILLHRDWMSGIFVDSNGESTENSANAIISKWRNGELADISLKWDGAKMKFYEEDFYKV